MLPQGKHGMTTLAGHETIGTPTNMYKVTFIYGNKNMRESAYATLRTPELHEPWPLLAVRTIADRDMIDPGIVRFSGKDPL